MSRKLIPSLSKYTSRSFPLHRSSRGLHVLGSPRAARLPWHWPQTAAIEKLRGRATRMDAELGGAEPVDVPVSTNPVAVGAGVSSGAGLMTKREAFMQTSIAVGLALAFGLGVLAVRGYDDAEAWFTAYTLEESLSIDNLFVFSLIFDYFKTPISSQPQVLRWGLILAAVLRASFILGGIAVVQRFRAVLLGFAAILLYSAYGLLTGDDDEEEDLSNNQIVKLAKTYLPSTDKYDGDKYFTTVEGKSVATPLVLALVCVELSDVLFAFDSIPAVFGITTDPFLAFTSNAFALLGLRALYTLVSDMKDNFEYLRPAIAVVLGFVGLKLIGSSFGYEVPMTTSVLVVLGTLGIGIALSVILATAPADANREEDA